jgi:hypothetical protein
MFLQDEALEQIHEPVSDREAILQGLKQPLLQMELLGYIVMQRETRASCPVKSYLKCSICI